MSVRVVTFQNRLKRSRNRSTNFEVIIFIHTLRTKVDCYFVKENSVSNSRGWAFVVEGPGAQSKEIKKILWLEACAYIHSRVRTNLVDLSYADLCGLADMESAEKFSITS